MSDALAWPSSHVSQRPLAETRQPLTVTKRGRPVATLVPVVGPPRRGSLRGSVQVKGDIVGPILDRWDLER